MKNEKQNKAALVIVDCQNDFIKDASAYSCSMLDDTLIARIKKLILFCREKQIPVVYTQHSIKPDKSNAEFGEPKDIRACIIGTKGWEIIKELSPQPSEAVIQKDKYDAFYGTNLEETLKNIDADTLILCGVLTNNCVRATAEGAHYRNYSLIIVSDCCGATDYFPNKTAKITHDEALVDMQKRMYETCVLTFAELSH